MGFHHHFLIIITSNLLTIFPTLLNIYFIYFHDLVTKNMQIYYDPYHLLFIFVYKHRSTIFISNLMRSTKIGDV